MIKIFISLVLSLQILSAGLVDAIAIKVNDDIVTLYDIDEKMQNNNVNKETAVNMIIDELLFQQELEKHRIIVSDVDIEGYLVKLAQSNKMQLEQFKEAVKQQQNYDVFIDSVKQKLQKLKLSQKVIRGNLKAATDEDIKIYYDNNQNLFEVAKKIDTLRYLSKDKNLLVEVSKNPMYFNNAINRENETIDLEKANNQVRYLFSGIKKGQFTKIATTNNGYVIYFVKEKKEVSALPFTQVKDRIYNIIMQDRESKFLKEYFNNLRIKSDIEVLR